MMQIEPLRPESHYLSEVVSLWNENCVETADCKLTNEEMKAIQQQLALCCRSDYGTVHIALDGGQLVGYGVASIKKDMVTQGYMGLIDELYVVQEYRKRQVGQTIVNSLKKWLLAKDVSNIQVFVDVENISAQTFWNNIGFNKEFYVVSEDE
ncbi:GNAT family N-acetyltransferase [Cerasibacillus sp. JNUCC 74]